jgi:hypothetical protein
MFQQMHLLYYNTNLVSIINPLNAKLNPICHLLALLGGHHILHVSRIRVKAFKTLKKSYMFRSQLIIFRESPGPCSSIAMITV